ncbi:MAG: hypothetical protein RLZZ86_180 [Cyanobacteriota bacterium]|jgi:hypothetical protein
MDTINTTSTDLYTIEIFDNTFIVEIPSQNTTIHGEIVDTDEGLYFDIMLDNPDLEEGFYDEHIDTITNEVLRLYMNLKIAKLKANETL